MEMLLGDARYLDDRLLSNNRVEPLYSHAVLTTTRMQFYEFNNYSHAVL